MGLGNIGKALIATAVGGPILGANVYAAGEEKAAQDAANQQNIASAREQQNFQERMANTSYQRAMKDMEAANLNPMLAFSQGGASTPTGAMATVAPSSAGMGRAVGKSISESINAASSFTGMANANLQTQSTVGLQSAQAQQSSASAQQAQANIKRMDMQNLQTQAETQKTLQDAKQSAETFQDRKDLLNIERKMKGVDQDWQEKEKWIDNGTKVTSAIGDVTGGIFKGFMRLKDQALQQANSAARNAPKPNQRPTSMRTETYGPKGEHQQTKATSWTYPN